ncbi:MAG: TPM domain-containing protein [Clostridia bacterium]|nr:TPM domain-containing protein [Clostridia bacterium]
MVRKLVSVLILLVLLIPAAALAEEQIDDQAGVFSVAEEQQINDVIDRIEKHHQVDIVVLTTYDVPYDYSESMYRVRDYADDFYDQGGYGMGPDYSGMLYLIDMNNRVQWISTGGVMIEYINDAREEEIFDAADISMRSGAYGTAVLRAMQKVENLMNKGRAEGTFLYDEATGQRLSGIYNALTAGEMLLAAIAGAVVAIVFGLCVSASYSLRGSTYKYDLAANSGLKLTRDDGQFLRQTVNRTARAASSSSGRSGGSGFSGRGGSGVHRSSSGRSHGGGGRRF